MPLAIVPKIGVYIDTPTYLFISKRHPRLAKRIEKGFEMMIDSGKFDEIFYKWQQKNIDQVNFSERTFFKLDNPLFPSRLNTLRPELMFTPEN